MRVHIKIAAVMLLLLAVAAWPRATYADGISLTLSAVAGAPGTTVTVEGTISNTGSSTVFLNGENFTLSSGFFSNSDITDFFVNAPLSLDSGTNSGLIALFTFDVAAGTPGGIYTGNFLDIVGGPGSSDANLLASAAFPVTVAPVVATPEPGIFALFGSGFALWIGLRIIAQFLGLAGISKQTHRMLARTQCS
jgi:hypothetical protein